MKLPTGKRGSFAAVALDNKSEDELLSNEATGEGVKVLLLSKASWKRGREIKRGAAELRIGEKQP